MAACPVSNPSDSASNGRQRSLACKRTSKRNWSSPTRPADTAAASSGMFSNNLATPTRNDAVPREALVTACNHAVIEWNASSTNPHDVSVKRTREPATLVIGGSRVRLP